MGWKWDKKRACPKCHNYMSACVCPENQDALGTVLKAGATFDWISPTADVIEHVAKAVGRIGKVETITIDSKGHKGIG